MNPVHPFNIKNIQDIERVCQLSAAWPQEGGWLSCKPVSEDNLTGGLTISQERFDPGYFQRAIDKIEKIVEKWSGLIVNHAENDTCQSFVNSIIKVLDSSLEQYSEEKIGKNLKNQCEKIKSTLQALLKGSLSEYMYTFWEVDHQLSACVLSQKVEKKRKSTNDTKFVANVQQFWKYHSTGGVKIERRTDAAAVEISYDLLQWLKEQPKITVEALFKKNEMFQAYKFLQQLIDGYALGWGGGASWFHFENDELCLVPYKKGSEKKDVLLMQKVKDGLLKLYDLIERWSGLLNDMTFQNIVSQLIERCEARPVQLQDHAEICKKLRNIFHLSSQSTFTCQYLNDHRQWKACRLHGMDSQVEFWKTVPHLPAFINEVKIKIPHYPSEILHKELLQKLSQLKVLPQIANLLEECEIVLGEDLENVTPSLRIRQYVLEFLIQDSEMINRYMSFNQHASNLSTSLSFTKKILIEGVSIEIFMTIMKILYMDPEEQKLWDGQVFTFNWDNIFDLYKAADYLMIPKIQEPCRAWLSARIQELSFDHHLSLAFNIFKLAAEYHDESLIKVMWVNFFQKELFKMVKNENWLEHYKEFVSLLVKNPTMPFFKNVLEDSLTSILEYRAKGEWNKINTAFIIDIYRLAQGKEFSQLNEVLVNMLEDFLDSNPDAGKRELVEDIFLITPENETIATKCFRWLKGYSSKDLANLRSFIHLHPSLSNFENICDEEISSFLQHVPERIYTEMLGDFITVGIKSLDLSKMVLSSDAFEKILQMQTLESLNLSSNASLNDEDLERLIALKELKTLDLSHCVKITDSGMQHLKTLPLETLILDHCSKIDGSGFENVQNSIIKTLSLKSTSLKADHLKFIANFSSLEDLNLSDCIQITNESIKSYVRALNSPSKLTHLQLGKCYNLNSHVFEYLCHLPLISLVMDGQSFDLQDKRYWSQLSLEELSLIDIKTLNEEWLTSLNAQQLNRLIIKKCPLVDENAIKVILNYPALQTLFFSEITPSWESSVFDACKDKGIYVIFDV